MSACQVVLTNQDFTFSLPCAAGLTCVSALAIGATIWWLRSDAIADSANNSNNLATVLAHQIDNSVQSIDLVLSEIRDREEVSGAQAPNDFDGILRNEDTNRFLLERLPRLQQASFFGLVDKNGILVNTTRQWPSPKIDLSDRAYFPHFKYNDDKGVFSSAIRSSIAARDCKSLLSVNASTAPTTNSSEWSWPV